VFEEVALFPADIVMAAHGYTDPKAARK